jgi:hypothetical protein
MAVRKQIRPAGPPVVFKEIAMCRFLTVTTTVSIQSGQLRFSIPTLPLAGIT